MTQHIMVVRGLDGKPVASPALAGVWRDDQTVMWGVTDGFTWADDQVGGPIQFFQNRAGYANWPGSAPAPVGTLPPGEPDTRYWISLCNYLNEGLQDIRYGYDMWVYDSQSNGGKIHVGAIHHEQPELVDPVIDNHPEP